jgi:hypothetical protein
MESGPCTIVPPHPTDSTTGQGATQFNCIVAPTPRKPTPVPLYWWGSLQSAKA